MCPVRIRVGVSDSVYAVWYIYQGDPLVPIWLPGHGAIGLSRHTTCEIVLKIEMDLQYNIVKLLPVLHFYGSTACVGKPLHFARVIFTLRF